MRALSIRQPWAWAIIHAGKDVENRSWHTNVRGRILIHASKGGTKSEFGDACAAMHSVGIDLPDMDLDGYDRGAIIGAVTLADCVESSKSPWFVGPFGFVLTDPKPAPRVVPCVGMQGFFTVPADVAAQLRGEA